MARSIEERQGLLKKALTGNAVFSVISGVAILFANRWLVRFLGLPEKASLSILGVCLVVYATVLWFQAHRPTIKISDAWVAVIMDAIWVVGSYMLIFAVRFSVGGKWTVALVAEVVLVFAMLQWFGIRRIRKGEQFGT